MTFRVKSSKYSTKNYKRHDNKLIVFHILSNKPKHRNSQANWWKRGKSFNFLTINKIFPPYLIMNILLINSSNNLDAAAQSAQYHYYKSKCNAIPKNQIYWEKDSSFTSCKIPKHSLIVQYCNTNDIGCNKTPLFWHYKCII